MTSTAQFSIPAMLFIGLMGAGHCLGMCGGISSALGIAASENRRLSIIGGYHLGRITSYSLAGAVIGLLGLWGNTYLGLQSGLRILAGVLLVLMGFYLADWWRALLILEKAGTHVWKHIQPLGNRLFPVQSPLKALMLGMLWGWLPCGLVYSALAYSATAGNPAESGLMMMAFGLGTTPAVLAGTIFANRLVALARNLRVRQFSGMLLIVFGIWTIWGGSNYHDSNHLHSPASSSVHSTHEH